MEQIRNHKLIYPRAWAVVVFFLTAYLFTVLFPADSGLAESHFSGPRFQFCRVMVVETVCAVFVAWICRHRFYFVPLDGVVFLSGIYMAWRYYGGGDMLAGRTELTVLVLILYFIFRLLHTLFPGAGKVMQWALVMVCLGEGVYGLAQLYGYASSGHILYRLTGSFFNPGPYSGFLAVLLPVVLHTWLCSRRKAAKIVAGMAFLTALSVLPAGMSRSSWLATAMGCGIVLLVYYRVGFLWSLGWQKFRNRMAAGIVIALMAGVSGLIGLYAFKKDSADGRMLMWKVAGIALAEQPWTGVGTGYFGGAYGKAQAAYFASGSASEQEIRVAGVPEYGFNEYLQVGVEWGIVGLLFFLLLLGTALWQVVCFRPPGWPGICGGIAAFAVFACFSYPLSILAVCEVLVVLLVLSGGDGEESVGKLGKSSCAPLAIVLAGVCMTGYIVRDKAELREAYASWDEEQRYFRMNIFEGTVDNYRKLYPLLREESRFLFEYGQCLSKTGVYEESNRILSEGTLLSADPMFYNILGKNEQALKQEEQAEAFFLRAASQVPNRLYPHYLLLKLYASTGQTDLFLQEAPLFLSKTPKVMSQAVKEMKEEIADMLKEINDPAGKNK